MATAGCVCAGTMNNTGYPNAKPFGVVKGKGFMPLVADDGTRNGIDASSLTLEADIFAAVNNIDPSKRLYLFTNIQNASAPEADPNYATSDLNERYKTSEWGVTEQFFDKVQSQCVSCGEYEIDVCGNLKGQKEGTMLYPRPVNKSSYNAKFQGTTAATQSMVSFNYDYEYTTNDGNQWQIAVVASFDYGYANAVTPWQGALLADFSSANITTPAVISIASVTATGTAGTYTVVIPAQIASDNCTLSAFRAASGTIVNGYESAATNYTAL